MIPPGFLQELLTRVDVVDVIGRHVELKRAGAHHKGLCPFHGEKSPSFMVSPSRQTYHCFGCGAHGDALRFLVDHTGIGFVDAVHELAQQAGLQVPDDERSPDERAKDARVREQQATLTDVLARAGEHYRKQLKASPRAVDYLKKRGLTGEIAARFGIGYAPDGWRGLASVFPRYDDPLLAEAGLVIVQGPEDKGSEAEQKRYDRFRDRIMFPIRSVQGEVIGFGGRVLDRGEPKYLNSPETPVFVKGRELYGLYESRPAMRRRGYALVVEGYMDVVALAQLGFENAVATLGTACTEEHVRKLFRFTDSIVFSFDGDTAGRRAAARALEAALPHASDVRTLRFLFLPTEHDPDSFVRAEGAEAFEACVARALPLSRMLIDVAGAECDLSTPEGRARFLSQARPMWSALPEGALRPQMLSTIAETGRISVDELSRLWGAARRPAARHAAAVAPAGTHRPEPNRRNMAGRIPLRGPADNVARLLVLHNEWWDALSVDDLNALHAVTGWQGELLRWLERQITDHGPQPWPALRAALSAEPWAAEAVVWIDGADLGFEALRDDLDQALQQLRSAPDREKAFRQLGRL